MKCQIRDCIRISGPVLAVFIAVITMRPCIAENAMRDWTNADGGKTFKGVLLSSHESTGNVTVRMSDGKQVTFRKELLSQADLDYLRLQASPAPPSPRERSSRAERKSRVSDKDNVGKPMSLRPAGADAAEFEFIGEAVVRLLKTGDAAAFAKALYPSAAGTNEAATDTVPQASVAYSPSAQVESAAKRLLEAAKPWNVNFSNFDLKARIDLSKGGTGSLTGEETAGVLAYNSTKMQSWVGILVTATPLPGVTGMDHLAGDYRIGIQHMEKLPQGWTLTVSYDAEGKSHSLRWEVIPKSAVDEQMLPRSQRLGIQLERIDAEVKELKANHRAEAARHSVKKLLDLLVEFKEFADTRDVYDSQPIYARLTDLLESSSGDDLKFIAQTILNQPVASKLHWRSSNALDPNPFVAKDHIGKRLDIKFTAIDGRQVDLADMRGKVVLVQFWGTWCGSCLRELPDLVRIHEKYRSKGFEIIGICLDQDPQRVAEVLKNLGVTWPQRMEGPETRFSDESYIWKFKIRSYPTIWLFDKRGKLASTSIKINNGIEQKIEELLK